MQNTRIPKIDALGLAELISEKIGSYVHREFIEFVAVDGDTLRLWYMNSGGKGPSIEITLGWDKTGWSATLIEHPPGTEPT